MKKFKIIGILMMILMISFSVKAAEDELEACTVEKKNKLKEIANKLEFNYTYEIKGKDIGKHPEFTITVTNLHKDLKVLIIRNFYSMDYDEFRNDGTGKGSIKGFSEGRTVTITVKAYTADDCSTDTVLTKIIKLPYYNYYYDEEFCKTNPNFKYCEEFTENKITQQQYLREKNKYLESQKTETPVIETNNNNTIYIIVGIVIGIIIISIITIYIIKRRKKYSL